MASKEVKELVKRAEAQGWRVEIRGNNHLMFYPPDKTKPAVLTSSTPSDKRAYQNMKSDLRRSGLKFDGVTTGFENDTHLIFATGVLMGHLHSGRGGWKERATALVDVRLEYNAQYDLWQFWYGPSPQLVKRLPRLIWVGGFHTRDLRTMLKGSTLELGDYFGTIFEFKDEDAAAIHIAFDQLEEQGIVPR